MVYLFRSDIYLGLCYRLELDNAKVVAVIEDYVEETDHTVECYTCPDPDIVALFSTCITEFQSAKPAIEYAGQIAEGYGLKTKTLFYGDENPTTIKNYLSCPRLKIWGRVGHGNTQLIMLSGGSLTSTDFQNLGPYIRGRIMIFNSCLVHNNPFEPTMMSEGTYFFAGGDQNLKVVVSENVFKAFIRKAIQEEKELNQAFTEAEAEVGYYAYGWSGDPSGPPHYFAGTNALYMDVSLPGNGARWDRGSFNLTKWQSNVDGNVKIDLYKGGAEVKTLVASTENDGREYVEIANDLDLGNDYCIKITSIDYDTVVDESAQFSVIEGVVITDLPFTQNFDDFIGLPAGWVQHKGDDLDWNLISGPTPSNNGVGHDPDQTGPEGDHTTGNDWYFYVNANGDGHSPGKEASILTAKYDISNFPDPMLVFWAHMYSALDSMGALFIDVNVDGEWFNDVVHINGDQGNQWFEVKQSLVDYVGDRVGFRIRAITGANWCSDIAIDDFEIRSEITPVITNAIPVESFNVYYANSRIHFTVPDNTNPDVTLQLYSVQGKLIRQLFNGPITAGHHTVSLKDKNNLSAGTYLCNMRTENLGKTVRFLVCE